MKKYFKHLLTIGFVYSKWKERVKISEVWMTMLLKNKQIDNVEISNEGGRN